MSEAVNLDSVGDYIKLMETLASGVFDPCAGKKKKKKKGSDWSVWTMDKPHLAPTGTDKPAGGGLVLVDCLQITC